LTAILFALLIIVAMTMTALGEPGGGKPPYEPPPIGPRSICIIDECPAYPTPPVVLPPCEDDQGEDN